MSQLFIMCMPVQKLVYHIWQYPFSWSRINWIQFLIGCIDPHKNVRITFINKCNWVEWWWFYELCSQITSKTDTVLGPMYMRSLQNVTMVFYGYDTSPRSNYLFRDIFLVYFSDSWSIFWHVFNAVHNICIRYFFMCRLGHCYSNHTFWLLASLLDTCVGTPD